MHVKTAGKEGNCCSSTLHSWTGFPVASRIRSSPSTMTAAGLVACGLEISDGQSVMRGKRLVCKVSQLCLIIGRNNLLFYLRSALIVEGSQLYSV